MLDNFYYYFSVTSKEEIPSGIMEKYNKIFPKELIQIWKEHGFASFNEGIFKLINPDESLFIIEELKGCDELFSLPGIEFFVFGLTSFGSPVIFLKKPDGISVIVYDIVDFDYSVLITDDDFDFLFNTLMPDDDVIENELSGDLFSQCFEKLGPLNTDECYGFSPLPALGGDKSIEYVKKVKFREYLSVCTQSNM